MIRAFRLQRAALLLFLFGAACAPTFVAPPTKVEEPKLAKLAQSEWATSPETSVNQEELNAFAIGVLNAIQPLSIAENREYCGYIYATEDGFGRTVPSRGGNDYCEMLTEHPAIVASWHTHAAFSREYDNEIPSESDMESDFAGNIDGYISTPAGRVWLVDHETRRAIQLCGPDCIASDPRSDPLYEGEIPQILTLAMLRAR